MLLLLLLLWLLLTMMLLFLLLLMLMTMMLSLLSVCFRFLNPVSKNDERIEESTKINWLNRMNVKRLFSSKLTSYLKQWDPYQSVAMSTNKLRLSIKFSHRGEIFDRLRTTKNTYNTGHPLFQAEFMAGALNCCNLNFFSNPFYQTHVTN